MTISVIIPLYNKQMYIKRAIESVLIQTYSPYEIIIIDDGSTDNGPFIVSCFNDKRIRLISQSNAGVSSARNRGIKEAAGDFIAFLDADDEWMPMHLEQCIAILSNNNLHWCCSAYLRQPMNTSKCKIICYPLPTIDNVIDDFCVSDGRYDYVSTSTMIVKRKILNEFSGFSVDLRHGEDKFLWFQIGLKYPNIGYASTVHAVYWSTEGSLTNDDDDNRKTDDYESLLNHYIHYMASISDCHQHDRALAYIKGISWNLFRTAIKSSSCLYLIQIFLKYGSMLRLKQKCMVLISITIPKFVRRFLTYLNSKINPW